MKNSKLSENDSVKFEKKKESRSFSHLIIGISLTSRSYVTRLTFVKLYTTQNYTHTSTLSCNKYHIDPGLAHIHTHSCTPVHIHKRIHYANTHTQMHIGHNSLYAQCLT